MKAKRTAKPTDPDAIDEIARQRALEAAQYTVHESASRGPLRGDYASSDLAATSAALGTGRPALPGALDWRIAGERGTTCEHVPADASDKNIRAEVTWREWSPKRAGQGEREAMSLERGLRKLLRKLDGGATTYEASIRRLALNGRLSKDKACSECAGSGFDVELINIANLPCAACCGTGKNPITLRKRQLVGFLDETRYTYTLDGVTMDADAEPPKLTMLLTDRLDAKNVRVMARAFGKKRGRPETGGACRKRAHTWNEDSTRKWCTKCGAERIKK